MGRNWTVYSWMMVSCGFLVITDGNVKQINSIIDQTGFGKINKDMDKLDSSIQGLYPVNRDVIFKVRFENIQLRDYY